MKISNKLLSGIFPVLILLLVSCERETPTPNNPTLPGEVYVAATLDSSQALLWKNGAATVLSSAEAGANSVFVSGSDVYVAGEAANAGSECPVVWKNGVPNVLSNSDGEAYSVFVSGTDVYVAGELETQDREQPVVWKNGNPTLLTDTTEGEAHSVFVSGSDVYVAGYEETGTLLSHTLEKRNKNTAG